MNDIKITYTNNEDDTTFVQGPRRTVLVCHNGCDYSVHTWSPHHRAFTDIAVNHAGTFNHALKLAKEMVK